MDPVRLTFCSRQPAELVDHPLIVLVTSSLKDQLDPIAGGEGADLGEMRNHPD
jgi:hypothetical protein